MDVNYYLVFNCTSWITKSQYLSCFLSFSPISSEWGDKGASSAAQRSALLAGTRAAQWRHHRIRDQVLWESKYTPPAPEHKLLMNICLFHKMKDRERQRLCVYLSISIPIPMQPVLSCIYLYFLFFMICILCARSSQSNAPVWVDPSPLIAIMNETLIRF